MKLALAGVLSILTPACVTPLVVERWKAAGDRPGETVTLLGLERGSIRIQERRTAGDVHFLSPPFTPFSQWDGPSGGGPAVRLDGDERERLIEDARRAEAIDRDARAGVVYDLRGIGPCAAILLGDHAVVRSRDGWLPATVTVAGRSAEAEVTVARAKLVPWFVPAALADGLIGAALLPFLPALYLIGQMLPTGDGCRR